MDRGGTNDHKMNLTDFRRRNKISGGSNMWN